MAIRTWVRLVLATLGVGALAGASQLGVAYGLGILRLTRVLDVTTRDQWTAQLAWVAWFAMTAAVVGALAGTWLLPTWSPGRPGTGTTVAISLAAGIGAAVVVPLTMQPARTAQIDGVHPVFVIGVCAGLGALVGAVAAGAALIQAVSRWSLVTVSIAVWVLAIVSVAPSLAPDDPLPAVRLGVFDAGFLAPGVTQRTALFTMPALALVVGALLGWAARRQGKPTLTIALAGLPGPALLTLAYLIAGPGSGTDRYQIVPYWAAMTATGAGVLGSVLAAVLRRGAPDDPDDSAEPTGDLPVLPRRTGQSESAIARAAAPPDEDSPAKPAETGAPILAERTPGPHDIATGDRPDPFRGPWPDNSGGRSDALADDRRQSRGNGMPGNAGDAPTAYATGVALGEYAAGDPPPFDGFTRGATDIRPTAVRPGQYADTEPAPYVPEPALRPVPPAAVPPAQAVPPALSGSAAQYASAAQAELAARNAGGRLGRTLRPFSRGRSASPTDDFELGRHSDRPGRHDAGAVPGQVPEAETGARKRRGWRREKASPAAAEPFAPPAAEPFAPPSAEPFAPLPPVPETRRSALGEFVGEPVRDDRTPARGPFAPEPQSISAPLPHPEPITPPIPTPEPVFPPPSADKRRGARQRRTDEDYVDWVSGLGAE